MVISSVLSKISYIFVRFYKSVVVVMRFTTLKTEKETTKNNI
jgi:hypothetical protein